MICPACGRELTEKKFGEVFVDVCDGGCGGIWLDCFELDKLDEPHEAAGAQLLDLERRRGAGPTPPVTGPAHEAVDGAGHGVLWCPRCEDRKLLRHFHSIKQQVEVDDCPECGGVWLDVGELATIRKQYATEEERQAAVRVFFEDLFGEDLAAMRRANQTAEARAQRIASAFRFLCPSNYLPGKQRWGAF